MNKTYVVSSSIDCVGHSNGYMYIRFKSGQSYSYAGVSQSVFRAVETADSVGAAFHCLIKGKYRYTRLGYDPFARG